MALNPTSFWRFEDSEGSTVLTDSSPNGNHLDWMDWLGDADGLIASSPGAAGTDQALATSWGSPGAGTLIDTAGASQVIWFKVPKSGSMSLGNVNNYFSLRDGQLVYFEAFFGNSQVLGEDLDDDVWHMLAVIQPETDAERSLFVLDGVAIPTIDVGAGKAVTPIFSRSSLQTVTYLSVSNGAAFDEYSLFTTPLTVDQVASLYETGTK